MTTTKPVSACHWTDCPHGDNCAHAGKTRCPNVLHIDWDGDPVPVREDIARCVLPADHDGKRHEGRDAGGSWLRW